MKFNELINEKLTPIPFGKIVLTKNMDVDVYKNRRTKRMPQPYTLEAGTELVAIGGDRGAGYYDMVELKDKNNRDAQMYVVHFKRPEDLAKYAKEIK
jgi:hypothetical protein